MKGDLTDMTEERIQVVTIPKIILRNNYKFHLGWWYPNSENLQIPYYLNDGLEKGYAVLFPMTDNQELLEDTELKIKIYNSEKPNFYLDVSRVLTMDIAKVDEFTRPTQIHWTAYESLESKEDEIVSSYMDLKERLREIKGKVAEGKFLTDVEDFLNLECPLKYLEDVNVDDSLKIPDLSDHIGKSIAIESTNDWWDEEFDVDVDRITGKRNLKYRLVEIDDGEIIPVDNQIYVVLADAEKVIEKNVLKQVSYNELIEELVETPEYKERQKEGKIITL